MSSLTAGEIVSRIKEHLGFPWRTATYRDTFKSGGPDTVVKGIATTMFCSYDTVRRAAEAGCNMIIPHEDTYWNDPDKLDNVSNDPFYKLKVDFMQKHDIVVFRMHDHMHAQKPDFTYVGCARALGLESKNETAPQSHHFVLPPPHWESLPPLFRSASAIALCESLATPMRRSAVCSSA